ncbi:MAG: ribosomal protein S18-alanine N-acetyltransferase [Firmicutes bacterium]|nr:ribosomal protein S18-alanine N-acetyltransferase [Bacillota bacterium]
MSSEDRTEKGRGGEGPEDRGCGGKGSKDRGGSVAIRRGTPCEADVRAVREMELACFRHPWSEATIAESLSSPACVFLLAEAEGSFAGSVCAWMIPPFECQVGNIGVMPGFRRRGVAETLMEALRAEAEKAGIAEMFLEVRVSNAPARALYEKLGFAVVDIRKKYYENTEDALVMRLSLGAPGDDR